MNMARLKWYVLFSLVIFLILICGMLTTENPSPFPATSRTLVTAAHLGEITGYQRVYVDESTDYAIHVRKEYAVGTLNVGTKVTLAETVGTVVSVSPQEFSVSIENVSKIVPGVSGTPVFLDTVPIGFISGWDGVGALRCIFY